MKGGVKQLSGICAAQRRGEKLSYGWLVYGGRGLWFGSSADRMISLARLEVRYLPSLAHEEEQE